MKTLLRWLTRRRVRNLQDHGLLYRLALHQLFHGPITYKHLDEMLTEAERQHLHHLIKTQQLTLGYGGHQIEVSLGIRSAPLSLNDLKP